MSAPFAKIKNLWRQKCIKIKKNTITLVLCQYVCPHPPDRYKKCISKFESFEKLSITMKSCKYQFLTWRMEFSFLYKN